MNIYKAFSVLFVLLVSCYMSACTNNNNTDDKQNTSNTAQTTAISFADEITGTEATDLTYYTGKIADKKDSMLTVCGVGSNAAPGEVYRISLDGLKILGEDGNVLDNASLRAGMLVEIEYDGTILESYPASFGNPVTIKVIGFEDDIVGLYLNVINDLYSIDPGLNSDISVIALDLSKASNLNEAEKSVISWRAMEIYGLDIYTGTYDELCEQGLIDKERMYFKDGILISIEDTKISDNKFKFNAKKWRGGDGAYFFNDCIAEKNNESWSYTVGSEMIS